MPSTTTEVVTSYMDAWRANDFPTMRSALADDLQFVGPIDTFDNADDHQAALQGLSQVKDEIVIHKLVVDGEDALVWYDLHTKVADPAAVAEWYRVEDGVITSIKVVFDPRPFAPPEG